jgi:hypothetical protein
MKMNMNMKMPKLSQQAMIVAVAAALPVLASAYKLRVLDAAVLALSGALAVYNVNCLTRGSCNTWATIVSISFFIMTILQLMAPREGMEGEDAKTEEVVVTDDEEVTEEPVKVEEKPMKNATVVAPTESKMPAETKKAAKTAPLVTEEEAMAEMQVSE